MYRYSINGLKFTSDVELTEEEQQDAFNTLQKEITEPEEKKEEVDEIVLKGTEYDSIFEEVGKQYNVNPELLKAIAKQESDFDPTAEGESGEIGMMQLMPIIRDEYIPDKDPTDPRNSVIGAAKFLQHLKKKYNNDANKVLQAYNGGETLLDKNPEGVQQTKDYRDSVIRYMSSAQGFREQKPAEPIVDTSKVKEEQKLIPQPQFPLSNESEFKIKYDDLYKDEDYFDSVEEYMTFRFGKEVAYNEKEESKEDYVRKFANHIRNVYYNNVDLTKEVLWTSGANQSAREAAGMAFSLWDAIPVIDGGYNKFEAFADIGTAVLFDPTTYFGAIAGKAVSLAGSKTALKLARDKFKEEALLKKLKRGPQRTETKKKIEEINKQLKSHVRRSRIAQVSTGFGVEATIGSYAGGLDETLAIQQYRKATFDKTNVAIKGAVSGIVGGITALPGALLSKEINKSEQIVKEFEKKISKGKSVTNKDPALKELERQLSKSDRELSQVFNPDPNEGRLVIDKLSKSKNELLQTQVHTKLFPTAVRIAGHIIQADRAYTPILKGKGKRQKLKFLVDGKEKDVSEAVLEVIGNLDKIDALTIESAAVRAGVDPDTYTKKVTEDLLNTLKKYNVTPQDFASAMGTTVSDGAKVLQPFSYVSNLTKTMVGTDKETQKFLDTFYTEHYNPSPVSWFLNGVRSLERTSKIWVTSALSTTSLNVMGGLGALTMQTAANVFESIFQRGIKAVAVSMGADPKALKIRDPKSIGEIFSTWTKLANYGMTSEVADAILKFNPIAKRKLINTLAIGEGDKKLNQVNRFLAAANLGADALFRKSAFVTSVESELKFLGKDLYKDYLKKDIPIPNDILKRATEDAMRGTFSFQFGVNKKTELDKVVAERMGNDLARGFIRIFENTPFASLAVAFPRFVANAVNFQYRYSPLGAGSGMYDLLTGLTGKPYAGLGLTAKQLTADKRATLIKKGSEAFARGIVGSTALYAAVQYRIQPENRETNWWNIKIGDTTFDARAFFPIAPYFAVAELIVRMKDLAGDANVRTLEPSLEGVIESVAGLKAKDLDLFPNYLVRFFQDVQDGVLTDRGLEYVAQGAFNFLGRFLQPIKPIREYVEGLSFEGLMARDPNVIDLDIYTGTEEGNVLIESLSNHFKNKLPDVIDNYGKDSLEKAKQYFVAGPPSQAGRYFSNFMGLKITREQTKIEKEVERLGITPWKMKVFRPTGIKAFDNVVVANGLYFFETEASFLLKSKTYKNAIPEVQKRMMEKAIRDSFRDAKNELESSGIDRRDGSKISSDMLKLVDYLAYRKISKADRKAIEKIYQQQHPQNKELRDTRDYRRALEIDSTLPYK